MKPILLLLFIPLHLYCIGQKPDTTIKNSLADYLIHHQDKMVGKDFPPFEVFENETKYSNDDLMGKVVLINFWFVACQPCAKEYKALNKIYDSFKSKSGFELVAFTFEKPETVKKVIQVHKLKYKIISISEDQCRNLMNNNGFPTNILLDRSGKVRYWKSGGEATEDMAELFFEQTIRPKIADLL